MINKILIILWFILRPKFYLHFLSMIKRKFLINHDTIENRRKAEVWAATNASSYISAFQKLGSSTNLFPNTIVIIQFL